MDVRYKVSATQRFCYEGLTVISSVPEKSVRCRQVSTRQILLMRSRCVRMIMKDLFKKFFGTART